MTSKSPPKSPSTLVAQLITDERSARRIAALVAETYGDDRVAAALVDEGRGRWRVTLYFAAPPDRTALRALTAAAAGAKAKSALRFSRVKAADWVRGSLAELRPVAAGRFVVHGAHDRTGLPKSGIAIEIEAALAFGSGHHGTTRGCLLALDCMCKTTDHRRLRILDLGTGTGVLAIAAASALHVPVLATDIDAVAVRVAGANARFNGAGRLVRIVEANGPNAPAVRARAPFDLVFANILLGPLKRFAAPLRHVTGRGGRIVLSGIVPAQANAVIAAYRPLALERRFDLDGWTTLVFVRRRHPEAKVARKRRRF